MATLHDHNEEWICKRLVDQVERMAEKELKVRGA